MRQFTNSRFLLLVITVLLHVQLIAQVGINEDASNPDPSAMLDVKSINKGLLIPRMTESQRAAIPSPATGLMIYQTDNTIGFYFYNGSAWNPVTPSLSHLWSVNGNAGTSASTHFIGTTDNQPLIFKVNNQFAGRIDPSFENLYMGLNAGGNGIIGYGNLAVGNRALESNIDHNVGEGRYNLAIGHQSMLQIENSHENLAIGYKALSVTDESFYNTILGNNAFTKGSVSWLNTIIGANAFQNNSGQGYSDENTIIGAFALQGYTGHLSKSTIIGTNAKVGASNVVNATAIGASSKVDCSNCMVLGHVSSNQSSNVRVGIGTTSPNASSVLELSSTTRGFLAPRMTEVQRNGISSPATGLMVFQTDNNPGFYFYNGTSWSAVTPQTNNLWNLNGNAGTNPGANFIGTTDNQPLVFKVNNLRAGMLDEDNVYFGTGAASNSTPGARKNIAIGSNALKNNIESSVPTGSENVAIGSDAMFENIDGYYNVGVGVEAMRQVEYSFLNVALGYKALRRMALSDGNVAIGANSMYNFYNGNSNTAIGIGSLINLVNGVGVTGLGAGTEVTPSGLTNATAVGAFYKVECSNCLVLGSVGNTRVGIGTTIPNSSAVLDLNSTNRGFLLPRMTESQRNNISSPAVGLMIYQTDNSPGFYYYNGSAWSNIGSNNTTSNVWSMTGNTGTNPATHFIGTTDSKPLVFKVHNILSGKIDPNETNTSFGYGTLKVATGSQNNTAFGFNSLSKNTNGVNNTAVGTLALWNNISGNSNTVIGTNALTNNTVGSDNISIGTSSLYLNNSGSTNIGLGNNSLTNNSTGNSNVALGIDALYWNETGVENTAIGNLSLTVNSSGSRNTAIGFGADVSNNNLVNATAIGSTAVVNASNKVRIGNSSVTVIEGQVPFTCLSDGRFKYNIQEDVKGLDFIMKLRPVTYQFDAKKLDLQMNPAGFKHAAADMNKSFDASASIRRTGFIAQEVEKAANESAFNFSGINKPSNPKDHYGLSYESFVVPLVKAVQEQQKQIEELKKENEELKQLKLQVENLAKAVETLSANK